MGTLYSCGRSRGMRVTWAAEEMGLDMDLVLLPFPPRAAAPEFLEINPLGTVPAYVEGDMVMTESTAILHYLAETAGGGALMLDRTDPEYGCFLDFLYHADATLTVPQTVYMRFVMMEKERGLEEAGYAYMRWFQARLTKVGERLEGRDYLCANRFTIADIAVGYALYLTTLNGLSDSLSPVLAAYLDRLMTRPAFARALQREHG
ncbi:Glutathione S-transferase [Sphingobium faniae]|nr:Glutathione S-transferase [Sphingobium faniae]